MPNSIMLKAAGLYTFANFLSEIPEGSLLDATNVVIDRDGIVEPRRGIKEYGDFGAIIDRSKQLLNYKSRVLVHYNSTIAYDSVAADGTFTDFTDTYTDVQAGLRIRAIELNGNYYVTTGNGIKKIAATSSDLSLAVLSNAGGAKALDVTGVVNYATPGFFTGFSKVAYRVVWGIVDVNDNLILGSPSSRLVMTNYSAASGTVILTFNVPDEVDNTNYFYQIYRTAVSTATFATLDDIDPGDEMKLVFEQAVTAAEILAGQVIVNDITPEDFQQGGTLLYTNPVSGDGILQANEKPPVSHDIAIFKNSAFYSNTRTVQRLSLGLLGLAAIGVLDITLVTTGPDAEITTSVAHGLATGDLVAITGTGVASIDNVAFHTITVTGATTFTLDGVTGAPSTTGHVFTSYITVTDGFTTNRYFFVGTPEITPITFDTQANTNNGGFFNIYASDDTVHYAVWYDKTGSTVAPTVTGAFLIRVPLALALVASNVDVTTDTFTFLDHGLVDDQVVNFTTTGTLPAPLVVATNYFVVNATTDTFQLSATLGGAAIDITTAGTGTQTMYIGAFGENASIATKAAVEANSIDFTIAQTSATVLTFTTANNGPATDATNGAAPVGGTFAVGVIIQGSGENTALNHVRLSGFVSPGQAVDDTARSLVRVINSNNGEIIYAYYLSGPDDVPGLMSFERRDLTNIPFTIQANNAAVGALFNPNITTAQTSTNEGFPNRIYFSKYQQPEAVPIVNFIDIGPKDRAILRIVPIRDSLFIFKEDGIYRLTGEVAPNFSVILFDNSTSLMAPDTAVVLNNQIYCLTDGGIATVTETGVGVVSRPIENAFNRIITDNFPNFSTASFGVGYETERSYFIWTVTNMNDTVATQCFRYNTFTRAWTRWNISHTAGIINYGDNKLYLGASDENFVEVERKALLRTDYADREFELQIPNVAVFPNNTLQLSSTADLNEGDAIVQTQYVSIYQYNSLLQKLDLDPRIGLLPGTFDTDYFATLEMVEGDNLTNKMAALVAKLNADPGTSGGYVFSGTSVFATIQTEFNTMIAALNADPILKFSNYKPSNSTVNFEMTVETVNYTNNTITSDHIPAFMVGPVIAFKGIPTSVVWAPISLGDPSLLKHIGEGTMLFESSSFRGAVVSYNSDLSPSFEPIGFGMDGSGTWGGFFWDATTWGGEGTSVPLRTLIPRQKQRCRYIRSKFQHNDAFYKFSILGISYFFEISSQRAYRGKR